MKNWYRALSAPLAASVLAILIGAILVVSIGYNPLVVYSSLFYGAFGSIHYFSNTLAVTVPLLLMGVGISLAFKAGLFNIGAQGQYWVGTIAAVWLGTYFHGLPGWLHVLVCLVGAMIAGALWGGLIPGIAKSLRGVNEVVTTMMLGYIGTLLARYMIEDGPLREGGTIPQSKLIDDSAMLHTLVPQTQLTTGIFIAILCVIFIWWILNYTTFGYQIRAVGLNSRAARYAGIHVTMFTVMSLAISGAFAGLAGGIQMLAIDHRLMNNFNLSYGFTAIVVALLARNNPLGCVPSAIFFAALHTGSQQMQMDSGVPASLADVLTGMIIFFVATERIIHFLMNAVKRKRQSRPSSLVIEKGSEY